MRVDAATDGNVTTGDEVVDDVVPSTTTNNNNVTGVVDVDGGRNSSSTTTTNPTTDADDSDATGDLPTTTIDTTVTDNLSPPPPPTPSPISDTTTNNDPGQSNGTLSGEEIVSSRKSLRRLLSLFPFRKYPSGCPDQQIDANSQILFCLLRLANLSLIYYLTNQRLLLYFFFPSSFSKSITPSNALLVVTGTPTSNTQF